MRAAITYAQVLLALVLGMIFILTALDRDIPASLLLVLGVLCPAPGQNAGLQPAQIQPVATARSPTVAA